MPRHFYECPAGHITEHDSTIQEYDKPKQCGHLDAGTECTLTAERSWMTNRQGSMAQAFKPTQFYINDAGDVINLGMAINDLGSLSNKTQKKVHRYIKELESKGYKLKELRTLAEYRKFRNEHNANLTLKNAIALGNSDDAIRDKLYREAQDLREGFVMERADGSKITMPRLDDYEHPVARKFAEDLFSGRRLDPDVINQVSDEKLRRDLHEMNEQRRTKADANFYIAALE